MSLLDKIFSKKPLKKSFSVGDQLPTFYPLGSINPTFSTISKTAYVELFYSIPQIYAIVDYLSTMYSSIPLELFDVKTGEISTKPEANIYREKLANPNQYETYFDFSKRFWAFYLTVGDAYIHKFQSEMSKIPSELFVLPANYIDIKLKNSELSNFETNEIVNYFMNFGQMVTFLPDDVFHLKNINLRYNNNYFFGSSPLESARYLSEAIKSAYELKVSMYQNRGAMGILSSTGGTNELIDDPEALHKKYVEKYGPAINKRQILISSIPVQWQPMTMPFKDFEIIPNLTEDFKTLCTIYNIPVELMNNTESSTYNNAKEKRKEIYTQNVIPNVTRNAKGLSKLMNTYDFGMEIKPDLKKIQELKEDELKAAQVNEILFRNGIISVNEWRSQINL